MKDLCKRIVCMLVIIAMMCGMSACGGENDLVEKALESIAGNQKVQTWLEEHDIANVSQTTLNSFKQSIPQLAEFLARDDVREKFETVGLPLIEEFLSYNIESMRLKAETLGKIIQVFSPELTDEVDAIFETAENP